MIEIPRCSVMTPELFNSRYKNKRPVILTATISDWLPVTTWKPEYLEWALSEEGAQVKVLVSHDNQHFINHPDVTELVAMPSRDFVSMVFRCSERDENENTKQRNYKRVYLRTLSMPDRLYRDVIVPKQVTDLAEKIYVEKPGRNLQIYDKPDCGIEQLVEESYSSVTQSVDEDPRSVRTTKYGSLVHQTEHYSVADSEDSDYDSMAESGISVYPFFRQATMQLWIGTRGNVTPLHYDRNHGLLAQIVGRKELLLFSPEDTSNLYPYPSYSNRSHTSRVNLRELETEGSRFPKLEDAQRYHCILQPGELLYMPPFWWHDVTSLDDCVSITLPWDLDTSDPIPASMLM
ncbi:jmjC domain-containing protein F-like [Ptychodera flava]|uniref:jmjC domain-containing protein F-like n=1 Tax=Ptychodera flava TaxID=63121 RepID=UPI003969F8BC